MDTQQEVAVRICPQCGYESPYDAQFCIECGESLSSHTGPTTYLHGPVCGQCGNEELPGARYCRQCGQSLHPDPIAIQPWAVSTSAPSPHIYQPSLAAHPQAVPQGTMPHAPFVPTTPKAQTSYKNFNFVGPLVLLGIALMLFTKFFTLPMFLLLVGVAYMFSAFQKRRTNEALIILAGLGIAALFWRQPNFLSMLGRGWPLLFFFFFFWNKKSRP